MKKSLSNVIISVLLSVILLNASCGGKSEDPAPNTPGGGSGSQVPAVNSANYNGGMIVVDATDADGTVAQVEFINNGVVVATDNTAPFEFNTSGLATGTYNTFQVKATDNAGKSTTYNVSPFTITGNPAPYVTATYANGELSISATDDGTIAKVEVLNGTTLLSTFTQSPYTYSVSNLSAGKYTYTITATDNSGGVSTTTVNVTIISGIPTFTASAVTTNGSSLVDITNLITDPENDPITISSATSAGATISQINGKTFVVNAKTSPVVVSLTISDGTNTITKDITVSLSPKEVTTNIMSGYIRLFSQSSPSGLRFSSNVTPSTSGTVSTGVYSTNFWGVNGCTSGTWVINDDGTLTIRNSCNNGTNYYTVEIVDSIVLKLTNINNPSYAWGGII